MEHSTSFWVPRVEPMTISNPSYVSSLRTTLCDISSTTNTAFPLKEDLPIPAPKLKPTLVNLPYDRPVGMVGPIKSSTLFQKLKVDDSKVRKVIELKSDREVFLKKLLKEKQVTNRIKNEAVIRIQALFRGYRLRRQRKLITPSYCPRKKSRKFLSQFELQDELCQMAMDLKLKPIDGLNLEWRAKASKRRIRIENAAAFRMQKFFRMLFERSVAQVVVKRKRVEFVNKKACVITKAVRFMKTKNFVKRVDAMKRDRCSIVIQRQVRKYQAIQRLVIFVCLPLILSFFFLFPSSFLLSLG
jgi:ribosomal protein L25 (general stress protein Ctc)